MSGLNWMTIRRSNKVMRQKVQSYSCVAKLIRNKCYRASFPLYRLSISEERFPGKSKVEHRKFKLLIYPIVHWIVRYKLYGIIMNRILIILIIYFIVVGVARREWQDRTMEYELIISMAKKEKFNCLNALVCALILQGDIKHVLTKN